LEKKRLSKEEIPEAKEIAQKNGFIYFLKLIHILYRIYSLYKNISVSTLIIFIIICQKIGREFKECTFWKAYALHPPCNQFK